MKQAFRRLSIRYHPDAPGGGDNDKFIEICRAYKAIFNRSETGQLRSPAGSNGWQNTRKHGLSAEQKQRNIFLFSTLAVILLIISVTVPFIYRKKIMLQNLNSVDPVLAGRQGGAEASAQLMQDPGAETSGRNSANLNVDNFIHSYITAYENKNLQQLADFFAANGLENGQSFAGLYDSYLLLFQETDAINLDISILSSTREDGDVLLRGRCSFNLTYPRIQAEQKKGQIDLRLTDNGRKYLIKELRYTFD